MSWRETKLEDMSIGEKASPKRRRFQSKGSTLLTATVVLLVLAFVGFGLDKTIPAIIFFCCAIVSMLFYLEGY